MYYYHPLLMLCILYPFIYSFICYNLAAIAVCSRADFCTRERVYAARLSAISDHALSGSVRCMLCSPLSSTMTLIPSPQSSSRIRISGTQSFPPRRRTTSTPALSMPGSISVSSTTAPSVPAMSEHHGKFISHVVRYILPAKISETHL